MDVTRYGSVGVSAAMHACMLLSLLSFAGSSSMDVGSGTDQFNIEQGIALEGLALSGDALETVQAVDRPPVEKVEAVEPTPEVKPEQPPEAITTASIDQKEVVEAPVPDPPKETPPEPPKPDVKPQEAVPEQVAIATEQASAAKQSAGDPTKFSRYLGELRTKLEKSKINPRSRYSGTVWLRFTLGENGEIIDRSIATSSGSRVLDEAAVAALDRAAPFPPIPSDVGTRPLVVSVPFKFVAR